MATGSKSGTSEIIMTTDMIGRFRRWFAYEKDAHQKVIDSLHTVPVAEQSAPAFQKAVDLFAHMMGARLMWLSRFGVIDPPPRELFSQGVPLAELQPLADEMHRVWSAYLARLDEAELARIFAYRSFDG